MPLNFYTKNINKRFTHRVIQNTLAYLGINIGEFYRNWKINIHDLKTTDLSFYLHIKTTSGQNLNPNIASGVTGKFVIDLYLHDSTNEFLERSNSYRIQHEICHAVLFGTSHFVSGVHSKKDNKKYFNVSFWYWRKFFWKKTQLSIIDIREFLD